MLSWRVSITYVIWIGKLTIFHLKKSMCRILQNQFKHFHKSDRSDISANVVDICLWVNTEQCHFKQRT